MLVEHQNKIISFAKWHLPVLESESYVEPPWRWPEETNMAVLTEWGKKAEAAKQRVIGNMPCYRKFPNELLLIAFLPCYCSF